MRLNTIKPGKGARTATKRVGRGIGSGLGKTCGKGHKGQKSRSGGYHKVGFEGGQMPIHRRLPKFGFRSRKAALTAEMRVTTLARLDAALIDIELLRASGLIGPLVKKVKVFKDGDVEKAITLKGLAITKGARAAIESAGGKVED